MTIIDKNVEFRPIKAVVHTQLSIGDADASDHALRETILSPEKKCVSDQFQLAVPTSIRDKSES
jgi:hypothetical protein